MKEDDERMMQLMRNSDGAIIVESSDTEEIWCVIGMLPIGTGYTVRYKDDNQVVSEFVPF